MLHICLLFTPKCVTFGVKTPDRICRAEKPRFRELGSKIVLEQVCVDETYR